MGAIFQNQNHPPTAGMELLRVTSDLILSIMPAKEIYYWHFEGDNLENPRRKPILITAKETGINNQHSSIEIENHQEFILNHQQKLRQGKFLITDLQGQYQELNPHNLNTLEENFHWLFLPACYQHYYLGGICLLWPQNRWEISQYNFLEAMLQNYGYQYFQRNYQTLSPAKRESNQEHQQRALNFSHIHHELRTPLTGILGFSKMLRNEIYGPLNQKQHQYVQSILNSAEHLLSLVNNFLDLSKIDANCEELFYELVAIEDICLSVATMLKPMAKEKHLTLTVEIEDEINSCYLDQQRWKQILINLLSNAIKFTEQGSVILEVKLREQELIFSVIDTGIGIKTEDQAQLFQPFKQIVHSLNPMEKGTGLGLALSRKLAQLHGGDIQLTSTPGQGSCFSAILPLKKSLEG